MENIQEKSIKSNSKEDKININEKIYTISINNYIVQKWDYILVLLKFMEIGFLSLSVWTLVTILSSFLYLFHIDTYSIIKMILYHYFSTKLENISENWFDVEKEWVSNIFNKTEQNNNTSVHGIFIYYEIFITKMLIIENIFKTKKPEEIKSDFMNSIKNYVKSKLLLSKRS
jgi:hypothetical protein